MNSIEIYVQGHGLKGIQLIEAAPSATIRCVLEDLGADHADNLFLEDAGSISDDVLVEELLPLSADGNAVGELRLHVSTCRMVAVSVRFNGQEEHRRFQPGTSVERVHRWATRRAFDMSVRDAADHVLQIRGTSDRPDRDGHVGALTDGKACAVEFDLVPLKRVEG